MGFQSILGVNRFTQLQAEDVSIPHFFFDLNMDQIVQNIIGRQKAYDLRKYYYTKPQPEDIGYRQEVLKDLNNKAVFQSLSDFAFGMRKAKEYLRNIELSEKAEQKYKWKLDAAYNYISSVQKLQEVLSGENIQSKGLLSFRDWLDDYLKEEAFISLKYDTEHLLSQFDAMRFNIRIKRDYIVIEQEYLENDYCRELLKGFTKQEDTGHYYQNNPFGTFALSELEAAIIDILKKPYAQTFEELKKYDKKYTDFIDVILSEFEEESQFYLAFLLYRDEMEEMNYHFSFPKVGEELIKITECYDLALARKNAARKKEIVYNDCSFGKQERFLIITGPNQGGKTTYARAVGQILYLGAIGLMVPALTASIPVFDHIYTHFAAEESLETGAGKLKEELLRLKKLMDRVTKNSFVIINEIFTSATSYDAYIMGKKVIDYLMDKDCCGIYVTHIFELTKGDDRIASLVASLSSEDSSIRTFKIERRMADGRSYANTIVGKYHMTYEEIKERIKR